MCKNTQIVPATVHISWARILNSNYNAAVITVALVDDEEEEEAAVLVLLL